MITTTTRTHDPPRLKRLRRVGLLLFATVALVVAGCGGSDTPAVCESLETLSGDIDGLQAIDVQAGEGEAAVAEIETSFDSIRTDLETVKTDAETELAEPIAGLESSIQALSADIDAVRAAGGITAASAQGLVDAVEAVGTSWDALKTAAPDCDL